MGDLFGSVGGAPTNKAIPTGGKASGGKAVSNTGIPSGFNLNSGPDADTVQFGQTLSPDSVATPKSKGKFSGSAADIINKAVKDDPDGKSLNNSTLARLKNPPKQESGFKDASGVAVV